MSMSIWPDVGRHQTGLVARSEGRAEASDQSRRAVYLVYSVSAWFSASATSASHSRLRAMSGWSDPPRGRAASSQDVRVLVMPHEA
jgi:hypothetical protein